MMLQRLLLFVYCILASTFAIAQVVPSAGFGVSKDSVLLGEHFVLAIQSQGISFEHTLPHKDSLGDIEVIHILPLDTHSLDSIKWTRYLECIVFETGTITIPSFGIRIGNDSVYSSAIDIEVLPPEIDSAHAEVLFGPTPILDVPFWWCEFAHLLWYFLYALLLAALLFLVFRWVGINNKKTIKKVHVPAHIWAQKEFDLLLSYGWFEQGEKKMFYSKFLDIFREYLFRRFHIHALEKTHTEILSALDGLEITQKERISIEEFLYYVEFIKYAKGDIEETKHQEMTKAFQVFIEHTKEQITEVQ